MTSYEKEIIIKKLKSDEYTKQELEQLLEIKTELSSSELDLLMEKVWENADWFPSLRPDTSRKIHHKVLKRINFASANKRLSNRRIYLAASAVAATLLLAICAFWWWNTNNQFIEIATANAEQKYIVLPDSSLVQLNANTTLKFAARWQNKKDRLVWLDGEAFFEVRKEEATQRKFQVMTPDLIVEVLGTIFNVNSHNERTNVYLEEGKIALKLNHKSDRTQLMQPGEMLTYSAANNRIMAHEKQTKDQLHTSWKDGVLTFEETPLIQVLQSIEAIYGIKFQIANIENYEREITTGLPLESLETILPMLEQALDLKIEKKDNRYVIK